MSALPIVTVLKNGEKISEHQIERDISIGREEGNVIRLDDRAISRKHAFLRVVSEGIQIEKKSQFGAMAINGVEQTSALIKTGDLIALGPYLIKIQMPEVTEPKPEPTAPVDATPAPVNEVGSEVGQELTPSEEQSAQDSGVEAAPETSTDSPVEGSTSEPPPLEASAEGTPDLVPPQDLTPSPENPFSEEEDAGGKTRVLSTASAVVGRLVFEDGMGGQREFIIDKDEISIGRSKDCSLPVDDKRLSRKHVIIRRQGLKFILKDLESANGTFINDVQVQEQELESGNTIRIGDTQFIFEAMSSDYSHQPSDYAAEMEEEAPVDYGAQIQTPEQKQHPFLGSGVEQTQNIVGISGSKSGGKKTLVEMFKELPPKKKAIYGVIGILFLMFLMEDDPEPKKKRVPASKQGVGQKATPTFENLTKKEKAFVSTQYQLAFDLYTSKQYDKAIFEVSKIFNLIPDYKDARDILRYAEEGKRRLAAMEAENKKKEEEARIRQQVAEIEEEISKLMLAKKFDQAVELFPKIAELDPENANIEKWQAQVSEYLNAKRKEEAQKALLARLTEQAKGMKEDAAELANKKLFRQAINKLNDAMKLAPVTEEMKESLKSDLEQVTSSLGAAMNPIMAEAEVFEEEKDFPKAYKLYEQASALDPEDDKPVKGIERIRDTLHLKAKGFYTEGLLYESYSDFEGAKAKFQEAKDTAPVDDEYYAKATSKLKKFEVLYLAYPSAPRQPASAGPPQFSTVDLQPNTIPGVPVEAKPTVAPVEQAPAPQDQPPQEAPQIPDFSQILQNLGGAIPPAGGTQ